MYIWLNKNERQVLVQCMENLKRTCDALRQQHYDPTFEPEVDSILGKLKGDKRGILFTNCDKDSANNTNNNPN